MSDDLLLVALSVFIVLLPETWLILRYADLNVRLLINIDL
jgi:hypothetical protein